MTESGKADQTRQGLIDSVKGKAKEVIGAMTGNDSLTAEGQLEQTEAQQRREASKAEAIADAEARKAREEAAEAKLDSAAGQDAINAEAAAEKAAIRTEQASQKRATQQVAHAYLAKQQADAERDAARRVENAKAEERAAVRAADEEVVDALDDHQAAVRESAKARAEADRLRQQADMRSDR